MLWFALIYQVLIKDERAIIIRSTTGACVDPACSSTFTSTELKPIVGVGKIGWTGSKFCNEISSEEFPVIAWKLPKVKAAPIKTGSDNDSSNIGSWLMLVSACAILGIAEVIFNFVSNDPSTPLKSTGGWGKVVLFENGGPLPPFRPWVGFIVDWLTPSWTRHIKIRQTPKPIKQPIIKLCQKQQ